MYAAFAGGNKKAAAALVGASLRTRDCGERRGLNGIVGYDKHRVGL